jgi:arsenite-transporting ATPase
LAATPPSPIHSLEGFGCLGDLVKELLKQPSGVILTMGKGGVGKTSIAIQLAERLAEKGARVRLTTTDPGGDLVERMAGNSSLQVSKIDPAREVASYTAEVLARSSSALDAQALELLREDLRSPCTEEIAVFRAFAEAVNHGAEEFVVIDTAPTGHTILLMDATESYNREISRSQDDVPESVRRLLPRLRDPNYTRILLVALPEPTPVHEARALQADLRRAGIEPFAWVINRSLLGSGTTDPLLAARAANEVPCLEEILSLHERAVLVGYEPAGSKLIGGVPV